MENTIWASRNASRTNNPSVHTAASEELREVRQDLINTLIVPILNRQGEVMLRKFLENPTLEDGQTFEELSAALTTPDKLLPEAKINNSTLVILPQKLEQYAAAYQANQAQPGIQCNCHSR